MRAIIRASFATLFSLMVRSRTALGAGARAAAELALAAGSGLGVERYLRQRRTSLALAVALGDLAGELALERVTAILSDFADWAIDEAVTTAMSERTPGDEAKGFAVIAMGKLGSHELNYSSDVDLIFLFDPTILARKAREDPGEAAVRIGRRTIELLQKRTEDGYVQRVDLRLRPSPKSRQSPCLSMLQFRITNSSAQPWERAAFIRARSAAGDIALGERFLNSIQPFVWRRSLDFGVIEEVRQISARIRIISLKERGSDPDLISSAGGEGFARSSFSFRSSK